MAVNLSSPTLTIKKWGPIDVNELLKLIRNFLATASYSVVEKGHEFKGSEEKVDFSATKNHTWFCQFQIDVTVHIRNLEPMKIKVNGVEKQMVHGRMILTIDSQLNLDYTGSFEKNKFLLFARELLMSYIWKKRIGGGWGDDLYYFCYRLHREIKKQLDFETKTDSSRYKIG